MTTAPEDFLCPITLDLMSDPVILPTGQTYDRTSIQIWFASGHHFCPKTNTPLQDTTLIPNYALRSLISQWALTHNIPLKKPSSPSAGISPCVRSRLIHLSKSLRSHLSQSRKDAVSEVLALAKEQPETKSAIMESGLVAGIFSLMSDPSTERQAAAVVFYLSLEAEIKVRLVAAGAVGAAGLALHRGLMDTRCIAALILTSLATADANKPVIGRHVGILDSLVTLVKEGNARAKREAVACLCSLCLCAENRKRAVIAGVTRAVLRMLEGCGMCEVTTEHALRLLSMLCGVGEGRALVARDASVRRLAWIMREGTARIREYAAAVLLSVCCTCKMRAREAREAGLMELCTKLLEGGGMRTKRKVFALAKAMEDC